MNNKDINRNTFLDNCVCNEYEKNKNSAKTCSPKEIVSGATHRHEWPALARRYDTPAGCVAFPCPDAPRNSRHFTAAQFKLCNPSNREDGRPFHAAFSLAGLRALPAAMNSTCEPRTSASAHTLPRQRDKNKNADGIPRFMGALRVVNRSDNVQSCNAYAQ